MKINADHGTNNEDTFRLLRNNVPVSSVMDGAEVDKKVRCIFPDHDDQNPSMHVYDDRVYCYSCKFQGDVVNVWSILRGFDKKIDAARDLARAFSIVLPDEAGPRPSTNGSAHKKKEGCTLAEYAEYVGLPEDFLSDLRLKNHPYDGCTAVRMPYFDESGTEEVCVRFRVSLTGEPKVKTRRGDKHRLYGLWRLEEAPRPAPARGPGRVQGAPTRRVAARRTLERRCQQFWGFWGYRPGRKRGALVTAGGLPLLRLAGFPRRRVSWVGLGLRERPGERHANAAGPRGNTRVGRRCRRERQAGGGRSLGRVEGTDQHLRIARLAPRHAKDRGVQAHLQNP
jgi:hypothetical protein